MTSALTRHLKDFGSPAGNRPGGRDRSSGGTLSNDPFRLGDKETAPDLDAIRAAAREEGYQAAAAELRAEYERTTAEAQAAHDAACVELRQRLEIDAAETIGSRFSTLLSDLGRQIGDEAARALAPFVADEAENRLADRFAHELHSVLSASDVVAVTVSGPAELFARIKEHPALEGISLTHEDNETVDLKAEIGARILATRLQDFADALAEVTP